MSVEARGLENTLLEMYPEIRRQDLELSLSFDGRANAWVVSLRKGRHALSTHLDPKDAEECLEGVKCLHLEVHFAQFFKNF